jgi:hypothetical protein
MAPAIWTGSPAARRFAPAHARYVKGWQVDVKVHTQYLEHCRLKRMVESSDVPPESVLLFPYQIEI